MKSNTKLVASYLFGVFIMTQNQKFHCICNFPRLIAVDCKTSNQKKTKTKKKKVIFQHEKNSDRQCSDVASSLLDIAFWIPSRNRYGTASLGQSLSTNPQIPDS